jgi:hypothetical protein
MKELRRQERRNKEKKKIEENGKRKTDSPVLMEDYLKQKRKIGRIKKYK